MNADPAFDVGPEPILTRSLGMLTIAIGIVLLLIVLFGTLIAIGLPAFGRLMDVLQGQQASRMEAKHKAALDGFAKRAADAETDEQRAGIEAERAVFELSGRSAAPFVGMPMDFVDDPRLRSRVSIASTATVVPLLVMIVSGIGLVRRSRWSRTLALVSASGMIVGVVFGAILLAGLVPRISERWVDDINRVVAPEELLEAPPEDALRAIDRYEAMMGRLLLGTIITTAGTTLAYPALVLLFAMRRGVASALRGDVGNSASAAL